MPHVLLCVCNLKSPMYILPIWNSRSEKDVYFQLGRLECVQWLVRHTNLRDKLTSRDGDRSLLHMGAKYGKVSKQNSFITCIIYLLSDGSDNTRNSLLDKAPSWVVRYPKELFNPFLGLDIFISGTNRFHH